MPALYLVSTPIGNLGDLTYRAVEVLRTVEVVFAEDTRRSAVLLRHYGVEARLVSAHEHNEAARARLVTELLGEGKSVAMVTDAGTPLLSDPGARIVRAALDAGYQVVPIPGASALLAALVASGLAADRFTFYGFLPRKGGDRAHLLRAVADSPYTSILYESPQRVEALLRDLLAVTGPARPVAVARELTKLHEEVFRGTVEDALARFAARSVRGEIVVVVAANPAPTDPAAEAAAARALAAALLERGMPPSAVAKELRQRLDVPRNDAYQIAQALSDERGASCEK